MAKIDITGSYLKEGNGYFNEHGSFKIVKAKRQTINKKTPEFLIIKACCGNDTLPDGTKERYLSGIFWTTNNTFNIDFDGTRYNVEVTGSGFTITSTIEGGGSVNITI